MDIEREVENLISRYDEGYDSKTSLNNLIKNLCARVRDKALEEAANYEAERVKHFQACMDNEKTKNKYGYEHHQRVLWEYQAMRDEHIQSEKAIRALRAKGEKP